MKFDDLQYKNLDESNIFVVQNRTILMVNRNGEYQLPFFKDISEYKDKITCLHELGSFNGCKSYCAEITLGYEQNDGLTFVPIKRALDQFEDDCFSLIVRSTQILDWYKNHKYCGICGKETLQISALLEAHCKSCNFVFYPRISPSIIVLIKNQSKIIMARGEHFAEGVYGLIAGFVSPGETLEESVHREVLEEVGIKVKNIQYFGSQPWPFPDSLMIAFEADYDSGEIVIDDVEIKEAGWYDINNLPGMPSSSKSIARVMIDNFIGMNPRMDS
ncbi:NAD(+) diphosphatase [Legionella spiritensis]|uniref:NAD(+) diphosphatase n=1 Tax=Legionella spiritensis TaxID=452 RepID=UPI000F6FFA1B|nr:NAD(+) diphosphatase [Legionella spiritensis]VEG92534.1 NADH pyrophosphatase [Legionella spiritensis]